MIQDAMERGAAFETPPDYQEMMKAHSLRAGYEDLDPAFWPIFERTKRYTMTSIERMYDLYKTVEFVSAGMLPGCILETGVWRGGSMMLAALTLLSLGDTSRDICLFDTFEGHPKPDPALDIDLWGHVAANDWHPGWARIDEAEVRANMASTGYPMEHVRLVKGMVEETMNMERLEVGPIAVARLDTDWYAGAKAALEYCFPRIPMGGVLIVDDYGHYKGQRKAVDEYFANCPAVKMNRVDYSCRSIQKA